MNTNDHIIRATAAEDTVRAFAIRSTGIAETARQKHDTTPVVTAALGRLLSAGAMMGVMMKGDNDKLTIQLNGDGPAGQITVTADSHGNVKGFPENPYVDIPPKYAGKLDVGHAVGKGTMTVIMDLGLKEPYNGQVEIQTGEIGDDLAYYFTVSEQTPSAVGLGVLVDTDMSVRHAGGFIVQIMPDAAEETIALIEDRFSGAPSVTKMMDEGMSPEDILNYYLGELDLKIMETVPAQFYCDCTRDRILDVIAALGDQDLEDIIKDGRDIEVKCHFCNTAYSFTVDELKRLRDPV